MNCQLNIQRCLAIVLAFIALPQSLVLAQTTPPQSPNELYRISFATDTVLPPIKASDILDRDRDVAQWGDTQKLLEPPTFSYNTSRAVTRDLPQLWRMRVKPEDVNSLEAEYKVRSSDGRLVNPFSNVRVEPLPIVTLFTDPVSREAIVQGGVRMIFGNFSNYRRTGPFDGQISVCVRRRGTNVCL
ncbi:MAG: hypothetical protein KME64_39720 [Scytonematopsis contorta HA4267-MV1]|jgi:hypothetical protein|nr:hypothetical protein [Scytonematopsis contorta HA4267-MV1]